MTLSERGLTEPTVSLCSLLSGRREALRGSTGLRLADYVEEIVASGFPGMRDLTPRARRFQLDSYLRNAVDRDVPEQGLAVRKPEAMLAWLRAYAAATATTASYSQILDAATPGQNDKPARSTSIAYRDVLTQLWLLDQVPAWGRAGNPLARLGQAAKHHLADPAMAARLLGLSVEGLLDGEGTPIGPQSGTMLGHLFESLVTLCVRVPAQTAEASVGHLRTRNGDHEIDLVVVAGRQQGSRHRGQARQHRRRPQHQAPALAYQADGRHAPRRHHHQHWAQRLPARRRSRCGTPRPIGPVTQQRAILPQIAVGVFTVVVDLRSCRNMEADGAVSARIVVAGLRCASHAVGKPPPRTRCRQAPRDGVRVHARLSEIIQALRASKSCSAHGARLVRVHRRLTVAIVRVEEGHRWDDAGSCAALACRVVLLGPEALAFDRHRGADQRSRRLQQALRHPAPPHGGCATPAEQGQGAPCRRTAAARPVATRPARQRHRCVAGLFPRYPRKRSQLRSS